MTKKPRGRRRKYAEYDDLLASLPKGMAKRPKYVNGIGIFRGSNSETVWVKINLTHGGVYKGKTYTKGKAVEKKLGNLSSWSWKELEAKRDELQGRADRSEPLEEDTPQLFSDYANDWLARLKLRAKGYKNEEMHVNTHLLPSFGNKTLDSIRVSDFNDHIKKRLAVVKPSTVKREVDTLNAILNDAVRTDNLASNPGRHADKIKGVVGRQRFLDTEEILRLLKAAEEIVEWLPDFILWCLHSGMRRGEILQLLWSDVRNLSNDRQIIQVRMSKSDQPRNVTCSPTMIKIIERQKERKKEKSNRVFPLTRITLRRKWLLARRQAGLEDVTVHDLRRTHSTMAVVAGVDLRTLAGRLGHANLSMLEKHYAALVGAAAEDAAKKIEDAFSPRE